MQLNATKSPSIELGAPQNLVRDQPPPNSLDIYAPTRPTIATIPTEVPVQQRQVAAPIATPEEIRTRLRTSFGNAAATTLLAPVVLGGAHALGSFLVFDPRVQQVLSDNPNMYRGFHYSSTEGFADGATGAALMTLPFLLFGAAVVNYHRRNLNHAETAYNLAIGSLVTQAIFVVSAAVFAGALGHVARTGDIYIYADPNEVADDDHHYHATKHVLIGLPMLGLLVAGTIGAALALSGWSGYQVGYQLCRGAHVIGGLNQHPLRMIGSQSAFYASSAAAIATSIGAFHALGAYLLYDQQVQHAIAPQPNYRSAFHYLASDAFSDGASGTAVILAPFVLGLGLFTIHNRRNLHLYRPHIVGTAGEIYTIPSLVALACGGPLGYLMRTGDDMLRANKDEFPPTQYDDDQQQHVNHETHLSRASLFPLAITGLAATVAATIVIGGVGAALYYSMRCLEGAPALEQPAEVDRGVEVEAAAEEQQAVEPV